LHAPGECRYCDEYSDWQELRLLWRINFTGEHDENKAPCPSTAFRSEDGVNRWGGNVAQPGRADSQPDKEAATLDSAIDVLHRRFKKPGSYLLRWNVLFLRGVAKDLRDRKAEVSS
jgi:hypothetical protein